MANTPGYVGYQGYGGYGSVDWLRQMALAREAAREKRGFPKTLGEGIFSLGDDIADVIRQRQLDAAAKEYSARRDQAAGGPPQSSAVAYQSPAAAAASTASPAQPPSPYTQYSAVPRLTPDQSDQSSDMPDEGDSPVRSRLASVIAGRQMFSPASSTPNFPFAQGDETQGEMFRPSLYGYDSFNGAPDRPASAPEQQPAGLQGPVPLPPPRPVRDRSAQLQELQDNPELAHRILTIARGESRDPREQQIVAATILDRAGARNTSVARETEQYIGRGSRGYYPAETFGRGAAPEDILRPVLRGADPGAELLGFTPTGNASGSVATGGIRRGAYNAAGQIPGGTGETFVQQERPAQLARLAASRVGPEGPLNILPQAAGGIETGPRSPSLPTYSIAQGLFDSAPTEAAGALPPSAAPVPAPVRTASLGPALPPPEPPISQAPPPTVLAQMGIVAHPGAPPLTIGSALPNPRAIAPAPTGAPPGLPPGAPPAITGNIYGEGVPVQSTPRLVTRPTPPPIPQPTEAMQYWARIHAGDWDPALKEYAKDQYNVHAANQKMAYEAALNEYHYDRQKFDEQPKQQLDELKTRLEIAKSLKMDPLAIEQLRLQIKELERKISEPHRFMAEGTQYEQPFNPATGSYGPAGVTPGAPKPEVKPFTQEQANTTTFVRDVLPDISSPNNLKHGMVLANSPGSSAGSTLGGLVGLGNIPITKEYREAQLHFGRFSGAVLKFLSGQNVTPSEAERNLPAFIPRYGDTENDVREKIGRQINYVNAVASTAGTAGGDAIEKGRQLIMQANSELPPVRYDPRDTKAEKPAPGRRIILPAVNGQPESAGHMPWPKELLPK